MRPALLGVGAVCLSGCGAQIATLHVEDSVTTTVEAGTLLESLVGDLGFGDWLNMDVTDSAELANQGVEPGDLREVRLEAFSLTASAPDGADLAFLDTVALSVGAPDLDTVRIAHAGPFPAGQAQVDFTIDDVDLTPYAVSQSMTLTTEVTGRRPDVDTEVTAAYTLAVGVTTRGVVDEISAAE